MSKSYPYLAIARKYNVDYGLVLSYSDCFENKNCNHQEQHLKAINLISCECYREILEMNKCLAK